MRGLIDAVPAPPGSSAYLGTSCMSMKGDLPGWSKICCACMGSYQYSGLRDSVAARGAASGCPRWLPSQYAMPEKLPAASRTATIVLPTVPSMRPFELLERSARPGLRYLDSDALHAAFQETAARFQQQAEIGAPRGVPDGERLDACLRIGKNVCIEVRQTLAAAAPFDVGRLQLGARRRSSGMRLEPGQHLRERR